MNEGKFFCKNSERYGGGYMEFAFCRRYDKKKLFSLSRIVHWSDDSLYVDTDFLNEFTAEYGKYLEPCISPDGSGQVLFLRAELLQRRACGGNPRRDRGGKAA